MEGRSKGARSIMKMLIQENIIICTTQVLVIWEKMNKESSWRVQSVSEFVGSVIRVKLIVGGDERD